MSATRGRQFIMLMAAAIFCCNASLAMTIGHGVGWGISQLSPGIVVTNIGARGGQNSGIRSDGSIISWGWNPVILGSTQDTIGIAIGGSILGGYSFYLTLKTNHTVAGSGDNTYGQSTPPAGLSNVVAISAGERHGLALKSDGAVVAWGDNSLHQASVPLSLTNAVAIAAGRYFSMALRSNGTVASWGASQLVPPDATNLIAIAAGYSYSLGLKSNGTVLIWNSTYYQQLPELSNAVAIAVGDDGTSYHALALRDDHTLYAYGYNNYGQSTIPPDLSNVVAIAAGAYHNVALRTDGTVVCWGDNSGGQCNSPVSVSDIVAVSAGALYNLALKKDGTVSDLTGNQSLPAGLSNITAIATGIQNGLALRKNGTVVGWGNNSHSQTNVPFGLNSVSAIAVSTYHCLAVKSNGTVVVWGNSLGARPGVERVPSDLGNVVAVSTSPWIDSTVGGFSPSGDFALALKNDGTAVGWGDNGPYPGSGGPTNVPAGLSNIIAIAAGASHGLALKDDSTVVGWGSNRHGEATGVPNLISPYYSTGQVAIAGRVLSNVVAIAAGFFHSVALKNDGTVVAWGNNFDGEAIVPAGVSNVVAISAGFYQSLAIMAALRIDSINIATQGPALGFHTFAGQQYSVEYSPDLTSGSWSPLPGGNISGTGLDTQVIDTAGVASASRFYRLRLMP